MKVTTRLYKEYQDLFDFSRNAFEESLNFLDGQNANTLKKAVTLFHFVRSSYLFNAIYRLCLEGLAREATVILRSLLNLYINIRWLTNGDSEKRFERYADFEVVYTKLAKENLIKYGSIPHQIKNGNSKKLDEDFERVKKKYNLTGRKDFYNWSGKSIYHMAADTDVNLEREYKIIYWILSSIEHGGPESVRQYLDDFEKGKIIIKAGPRFEYITLVLITAFEYYFDVKVITCDIFELEWAALQSYKQTYSELRDKYWKSPAETE